MIGFDDVPKRVPSVDVVEADRIATRVLGELPSVSMFADVQCLEMARDLLRRVESAEVVSFAAAVVLSDGCTVEGFTKLEVMKLLGVITSLQQRMAAWTNQEPEHDEDEGTGDVDEV